MSMTSQQWYKRSSAAIQAGKKSCDEWQRFHGACGRLEGIPPKQPSTSVYFTQCGVSVGKSQQRCWQFYLEKEIMCWSWSQSWYMQSQSLSMTASTKISCKPAWAQSLITTTLIGTASNTSGSSASKEWISRWAKQQTRCAFLHQVRIYTSTIVHCTTQYWGQCVVTVLNLHFLVFAYIGTAVCPDFWPVLCCVVYSERWEGTQHTDGTGEEECTVHRSCGERLLLISHTNMLWNSSYSSFNSERRLQLSMLQVCIRIMMLVHVNGDVILSVSVSQKRNTNSSVHRLKEFWKWPQIAASANFGIPCICPAGTSWQSETRRSANFTVRNWLPLDGRLTLSRQCTKGKPRHKIVNRTILRFVTMCMHTFASVCHGPTIMSTGNRHRPLACQEGIAPTSEVPQSSTSKSPNSSLVFWRGDGGVWRTYDSLGTLEREVVQRK